ncbi:lysophospholipid acyltransferase family protein [Prochlorococcus marinus]|uniref:1-acyl-sn-glycerol-3-phosphate acyltransferase n=1 Tax=Prochlorococcus marinus XMU1408 TaxID=2213228 RepID=A0A318RDB3_PROMR|nr:lysophospholipid acyltransferase family protein [Prochlorococcus marinus]MBW3041199.1 1-acyl-sn-glycerol-3-phosphate acyltransferase [Prochlorococcus marinus str. XMU1408]PYE03888.1 1-acyl-sn-glycerol-3-phosphate acyltransferase [Prochlorococcus marinus XMU1408]
MEQLKVFEHDGTSNKNTPRQSFVYGCVSYLFVFPIFRFLFRGRTIGVSNLPKTGGVVVVSNHGSHLDPPILGHALGRPVAFMAKSELFRVPILSFIISACGAYPVKRGAGDREALRTASNRLIEGWATGVFLDGTRQDNGRVNDPKAGAALLAARTGSPILPVAIVNSHRAFPKGSFFPRFVSIHLKVGKLIQPPSTRKKEELKSTTKEIQIAINSMLDQGLIKNISN